MANPKVQEYFRSLSNTVVRLSPYAMTKTGLVSAQTILKIENYMLICSPYELSMRKAVLLLILSREETSFFQQYRNRSCSLNLNFLGITQSRLLNVKGILRQIGPVKGKQNLCMIELGFTAYPPELIEILGEFILVHNSLRGYFESFQGKNIAIDEEAAKMLRFNNYAECSVRSRKFRAKLLNLSVNRLMLLLPDSVGAVPVGECFPAQYSMRSRTIRPSSTSSSISSSCGVGLPRAREARPACDCSTTSISPPSWWRSWMTISTA